MKKPAAACVGSRALLDFSAAALAGFRLKHYPTAAAFLKSRPRSGLAVIEAALPDMSGRDLAAVLRRDRAAAGLLLVLAGPGAPGEAARSLEDGADEYFPFPPDPGLFRVRALNLLSRPRGGGAAEKPREHDFGALRVSPEARTASLSGRRLDLTALEFDLLLYFLRNQGRVVTRSILIEQVWKPGAEAGARSVDKRIEALRSALGRYGSKIRTVFGLGYIFKL